MIIRPASIDDIPAITAIYNEVIANATAVWTETPVTEDERRAWMQGRLALAYPVRVATDGSSVLGYGTFGDFRAWPGYRYTVEHSIYISADHRGRGIGRTLLDDLVSGARALGKHALIAGIDGENAASIRLHERAGFQQVGHMSQIGRKFRRWLDLIFMQLLLDAPGAARTD
jgi:L-amino acid N-acyltransferase YncA